LSLKNKNGNTDAKKQEGASNLFPTHTKEIADYLKQKDFSLKMKKALLRW
jgi:hypothetical protein